MTTARIIPLKDISQCCSLGSGLLSSTEADRYAAVFRVLAEPVRLRMISVLADTGCEPVSVGELTERMGLSQPTISHHLKKLTEAGLLEPVRIGRNAYYQVKPELFAELRAVLHIG